MATQDGGNIKGNGPREVIIIDASPTPEPEPGGARLRGALRDGPVGDSSQQPPQLAGTIQPTVPVPQSHRLVAPLPRRVGTSVVMAAGEGSFGTQFTAAFRNNNAPRSHLQQKSPPSPIVINDSPSPPPADVHSSIGLHQRPGPLRFPAVWPQAQPRRHNAGNMGHPVLASHPNSNMANFTGPPSGSNGINVPYNAGNGLHPRFHSVQPFNRALPTFGEVTVRAGMNEFGPNRNAVLPDMPSHQPGLFDRPLMHNVRNSVSGVMGSQPVPYTMNQQPANISASHLPHNAHLGGGTFNHENLCLTNQRTNGPKHGGHYLFDNRNAFRFEGNLSMQPDPFHPQRNRCGPVDMLHSTPYRDPADLNVDMGNLTDEKVLEIIELNPTIAKQFRSACALRLQQYQQGLDKAYNQRLAELEDYTRKWRDQTRELWQAVRAGQVQPRDISQQATLVWKGPQEMAKSARVQLPSLDASLGGPIGLNNVQDDSSEASTYVPTPASPSPVPEQRRRRYMTQPGHCQRRQVETGPPPSGPTQPHVPHSDTQTGPVLPSVQNQPLPSRPAPYQSVHKLPNPIQAAHGRSALSQPTSSSQPATGQPGIIQLALHQPPPSQLTSDESASGKLPVIQDATLHGPQRQLLCPEWISSFEGCFKDDYGRWTSKSLRFLTVISSGDLGQSFSSILRLSYSAILLVAKADSSGHVYRRFDRLSSFRNHVYPHEVVIELSEANVLMFGKAFCYIKERRELLRSELGLARTGRLGVDGEISRMYQFFSQQRINKSLNTMRHPESSRLGVPSRGPVHEPRSLLIARPRHQEGHITGAAYFNVGSEQPTSRTDRDNSIVLEEDGITFGRLVAMLSLCLDLHIIVIPDAPRPARPKETTNSENQQNQLVSGDPKVRWDKWVKVVHDNPNDYLRMELNNTMRVFEMGFHQYPMTWEVARALKIPAEQKLWLKSTDAKGVLQCFDLESGSMVINPIISGQDVVIQWTASNVLIFWKAFCLLKERVDRLSLLRAQKAGESSDIESPTSHERLVRYYRDFLARKDMQPKLWTISLPVSNWDGQGNPILDITSGGSFVNRRLILARPHRKDSAIDMAATEFFDVGTLSPTEGKLDLPGDIIIPEHSAVASRILVLLMKSIHMNMFPVLDGLGSLLNPRPEDKVKKENLSSDESANASQAGSAKVNVAASPIPSAASTPFATHGATLIKRVIEHSTNLRKSGFSIPSRASAAQMPSSPPSQPSPSLLTAVPDTSVNAAAKQSPVPDAAHVVDAASNTQGGEVIVLDFSSESKDKDGNEMAVDGQTDNTPLESRKRAAPDDAYDKARPVKRVRLDVPGSEAQQVGDGSVLLSSELSWTWTPRKSRFQEVLTSATADAPATTTARATRRVRLAVIESEAPQAVDEAIQLSSELAWMWTPKRSLAQEALPSAFTDTPAATVAPEETIVTASADGADLGCSNTISTSTLQGCHEDYVAAPSDSVPEQARPSATEDTLAAPMIVHRASTAEPEEMHALPSAHGADTARPKSSSVLGDWRPVEYVTTRSGPASEPVGSPDVTAAEARSKKS